MSASRLSKDQVSAIASSLDANIEDLCARPLDGSPVPFVWLDATHVKCGRGSCDTDGWRRILGANVVETESYDSRPVFLRASRSRGAASVRLVVSDAHPRLA